jgi:Fe-Mn family superoxide dismutase
MIFELPPLPYNRDSLEPHISAETLDFHYKKHHQTYVTNLNQLLTNHEFFGKTLEDVILASHKDPLHSGIFNNAAQVWNHTFYWESIKPQGGGMPQGRIKEEIIKSFGSFDDFKVAFKQAALTQFGSGWAWLVWQDDTLKIMKTGNADLPMVHGAVALMTCDVWEHAYYLDYQNRRADYVDTFLNHLVDWDRAAERLANTQA